MQSPLYKWCNGPGDEEEKEAIVELTVREQTLWPNDTPLQTQRQALSNGNRNACATRQTYNNGCGTEHGGRWANKAVFLTWGAEVLNVGEHPGLHTELHSASNDSGDNLAEEHRTMCDLHVMAELEVARELKRLHHSNITPCLEHHHRNRAARKGVADDQFRDDVEPNLLVRNGLDHTDRDSIHER